LAPKYSISIGYPASSKDISGSLYIGPLDIEQIATTNTTLEKNMNLGFSVIRPISKGVLWFLKFLHHTFNLNYGLVLIVFALLIRVVTGPLTKKSFRSSQKMQALQPKIKKMQEKLKGNPQKLNQEMMAFYKKEGVNPLGGCLPMLLQMPLLWALFVVFRSTIEFRGAPFVFWIKDLSQPDAVFSLPFSIPIYGAHVAVLPIIMGISMFMTQRLSMATMDKSQRPLMYFMSAFFFLIFNSFPSYIILFIIFLVTFSSEQFAMK
jgi:YidC/Oxa1 family membrane protein insertase